MRRILTITLITFQCSCASLSNGGAQLQPVKLLDSKTKVYITTCSGMAETIGSCHEKARETCSSRYVMLQEIVDSSGINREIKFQCL